MKKKLRATVLVLAPVLAGAGALFTAASSAEATEMCEQFGKVEVGKYIVQNNVWNQVGAQCINTTDSGFEVTKAEGQVPTNGAPKSYPSIFNGCHYDTCSPGTKLPARISSISSAPTTATFGTAADATHNAAYDIWLDPEPKKGGVNAVEIMVWANKSGPIQPIGSKTGTATVAGSTWEIWEGNNGTSKVISYVAPSAMEKVSFDAKEFISDANSRGFGESSWYLTSIQAGFEPWKGGAGLKLDSFMSEVNAG
ncbi:GH12 family glycosyl hydrolase domain-containing protein [Streptomyces sp. CA-250714]|uniref:GH12 family glycosyl hydrolase domain-containing protein n=1 Tax=Streptomyces sp. CA-250714 TaxID=3240060 RepID=UPI003D8C2C81